MTTLPHLIDGKLEVLPGSSARTNVDPATGTPINDTPLDAVSALDKAVASAKAAFPAWSETPVGDRVQHLFRYKALLEDNINELAAIVVEEHGKTMPEAIGSVRRGIDCIEHACGAPVLIQGRTLPQIAVSSTFSRTEDEGGIGIDSAVDRVPLGVCAGIT
ncbi:MAG: aldehyde dehydrogenase family protein, partial [Phycisphaerales bacterium]|nr:aldehyde dehydrogenase family protein [Phycisphaerales bacterium]